MIQKLIILALLVSATVSGQSLFIKGGFYNKHEKKIHAHFVLTADSVEVVRGDAQKVKIKLELNKDYVLTIALEGYLSKTIRFSTHTDKFTDYEFDFNVLLSEEPHGKMISVNRKSENGLVFYDLKKESFNYKRF